MDMYVQELIDNDSRDLELSKEKLQKYATYIGCDNGTLYLTRIDAIYTFENV